MIKRRFLAVSLAISMLFINTVPALAANKKAAAPSKTTVAENTEEVSLDDPEALALQVFDSINACRKENGLSLLKWNDGLALSAKTRALEISKDFSHERPDGSAYYTAVNQNGISKASLGEIIGYGQFDGNGMVDTWLDSDFHKDMILDKHFAYTAIGVYVGSNGNIYYVEEFLN